MSDKLTTINYEKYLHQQLTNIRNMKIDHKQKIIMLQGFLCLLKEKQQIQKQKFKDNLSTSFSEDQSNFTAYEHQIDDLQERILQKRVIKFQVNQQIQGIEEDLFQIQKTVDTKRHYDENLRKQVQNKMQKIQHSQLSTQMPKESDRRQSYINKSIGAVSGLFKGWLT